MGERVGEWMHKLAAELFVMAALGLLLGLFGPFGTFALPVAPRVAAWEAFALGGFLCFRPVLAAGLALHRRSGVPRIAAIALACAVAALPTTLLVAAVLAALRIGEVRADALAASYPYVLLTGAVATAIQLALGERRAAAGPAAPAAPVPTGPPADARAEEPPADVAAEPPIGLPDRLPAAIGRPLLCLEMEDHYVRAHGPAGSALVLMRMRDAADALAHVEGRRVHRSWWVARAAVTGVVRRDRAVALTLANGLEVPVARAAVPELRAAGWL